MTVSENQIVVYQPNETVRLEVRLDIQTASFFRKPHLLDFPHFSMRGEGHREKTAK